MSTFIFNATSWRVSKKCWRIYTINGVCTQFLLSSQSDAARSLHSYTQYSIQWRKRLICSQSNMYEHTAHRAVELARFQLAAGGGERSGPNVLLWFLVSFLLGLRGGWGEALHRLNVSETALMLRDATWANNAKCVLVVMQSQALKIKYSALEQVHTGFE